MLKWLWLSVVVIALDQLTKGLASSYLLLHDPIAVIPMFNLTLAHNPGAAFSFLSDAGGWQRWFFTALAIGVSVLITLWIRKLPASENWQAAGLAAILGGAIGNVIDRIQLGHVVDFLDFYINDSHWPAFNIADTAISVGAVILIAMSFRKEKKA
jgi:signal peptidase II